MSLSIEPLKQADLPNVEKPFWKMTGPGAILVGLAIGAGELVVWPWITAKFGASMIWAAALGIFLQFWINIEIGRWSIVTGESMYTGFARLWKGYVYIFILANFLWLFLPGWARTSGSTLRALLFGPCGPGPDWLWTGITFLAIGAVLFGPKTIYSAVERTISILIFIIVMGLLIVVFKVGTLETLFEMMRGFLNFGHIQLDHEFPFHRFFSAVVFAGAGGLANLYYAYYLHDKQIGMGARIPRLLNPLRKEKEHELETGFIFPITSENTKRFRRWFRYVVLDQILYFWISNSFTMFLFMFGALAVLRPQGIVPDQGRLIWDEAAILVESMGEPGRYLFLAIGAAALFSTQLAILDGGTRTMSDLFHTNFAFGKRLSQSQWYLVSALFFMALGTIMTWVLENFDITALSFIFSSALIGGFAMAIYAPLTLYLNIRYLPKPARPGPVNIIMVTTASAVYIGFALCYLGQQIVTIGR